MENFTDITELPWGLQVVKARFMYEYEGATLEEVAVMLNVPLVSVQREALENKWTPLTTSSPQSELPTTAAASSAVEGSSRPPEIALALDKARLRADFYEVYRREKVLPLAIAVEEALLARAYDLLQDPDRADARGLKTIHDIITAIHERVATALTPEDSSGQSAPAALQVNIQNNIQ